MIVMQLNDISKSFGAEQILTNIKLEIQDKDRIAIVGRNGAGKSTLLKIMAEEMTYDTGEIYKPKDLSVGYLSQHTGLESDKTIWEEMLTAFEPLLEQQRQLRKMEQQMADATKLSNTEYEQLLQSYDKKQQRFESGGGYHYETEIKSVLAGLHFHNYDDGTPINELSGGQKTRLALGKLLLIKPDLLILDEPTNHLDIDTLAWLENYLANYPGAVTIVSHDRYFLDKTANIVYEISHHKTQKFYGTYSDYLVKKAFQYEQEMKEFEKRQTEIKRMEDFIQKNIARASTSKRAQSKRKQLGKMDKLDKPAGDDASASFTFDIARRSGNDVLKLGDISFRYEGESKDLFSNVNLNVNRGERIALIGPNGVGKTTLLKIILGTLKPNQGTVQTGTGVQIGYYDQEQMNLTPMKTILQELWDNYPDVNERDIRTVLGNFLFSGDDVLKQVHSLSGGEKARLSLAKLRMQKANLLILDEPTNHLDIDSKEVLEAALMDFPGTIIFISHDRYFINKITDQVVELQQDGASIFLGDYDYYIEKKQEEAERERLYQENVPTAEKNESKTADTYREEKQRQREKRRTDRKIAELESTIETLENDLETLEQQMTDPEIYQDHEKALELTNQTNELKQKIEKHIEEWTLLQED